MMKFFGRLWMALVNFILILLPVVLLSQFLYVYREPIAKQFKQFLGDPVAETVATVERFDEKQPTPTHLRELLGYFRQLNAREELDEDETERILDSLYRLHSSLIDLLGSAPESQSTSKIKIVYFELLDTGLFNQLFTQPRRVSRELKRDWERVSGSLDLPAHPTEDLSTYLAHSDTAAAAIQGYSRTYSGQLDCPDLYQRKCDKIFMNSVEITADKLSTYFTTWPEFAPNLSPEFTRLKSILPGLLKTLTGLVRSVVDHLKLVPWKSYESLLNSHAGFSERFETNAPQFYGRVLNQFSLSVAEFNATTDTPAERKLRSLRKVETTISENSAARRLFLNRRNQKLRSALTDKLLNVYHRVSARANFSPSFKMGRSTLRLFEDTVQSLPSGKIKLKREKEILAQINAYHQELEAAVARQNYSKIIEVLSELNTGKISSREKRGWEIMIANFLRSKASKLTSPEWQPERGGGRKTYFDLIKLVGKVGGKMGLEKFSADWVRETILTLRSRRFRQLRDWVVENLDRNGLKNKGPQLRSRLKQLNRLNDLPEHLTDRPEKIIRNSILLEKIITGQTSIYENLLGNTGPDQLNRDLREIEGILTQLNNPPTLRKLLSSSPLRLTTRINNWFGNRFTAETGELITRQLKSKLRSFFQPMTKGYLRAVNSPGGTEFTPDQLSSATEAIKNALDKLPAALKPDAGINWLSYGNLLQLRSRLTALNKAADDLTPGSLLGENVSYQNYVDLTSKPEISTLPGSYNYSYEKELLLKINGKIISQADEFSKKSKGNWLSGWGGRLTGREIVEDWCEFLTYLKENIRQPELETILARLDEKCKSKLEELDDQN